jgi:hypothetical protein
VREVISDDDIEVVYRQFANFLLQLFKLGFDRIGNLPSPRAEVEVPVPTRPLTWAAYRRPDIEISWPAINKTCKSGN